MSSEFLWTGSAGDTDFGNGENWINVNNDTTGEPGISDVAVLEASGTVTGSGNVSVLDLISPAAS